MSTVKSTGRVPASAQFELHVDAQQGGMRIDAFIASQFPAYSRSFFQTLINDKLVKRNNAVVTKPGIKVTPGDIIQVQFPSERATKSHTQIKEFGITVLDTTEHFIIIYKPAKLLVHPPTEYSNALSLIDWLLQHDATLAHVGYVDRPGIVHRLDKDTSGIMIIPRTNYAHMNFSKQFKERTIHKTYIAIVKGHPPREGMIDLPIGRDPHYRSRMKAFEKKESLPTGQRNALTYYRVISYFDNAALVELKPVTGRTHQLRVHMTAIGHPIIGDTVYGTPSKLIDRQALHAQRIAFEFDGKPYEYTYPLPDDMQQAINQLKKEEIS